MKRILIALAAASALGFAAPAFAHDEYGRGYSDWDQDGGYGRLAEMFQHDYEGIEHGLGDGAYTRWEARAFYRELRDIRSQAEAYRDRDGFSPWERQAVERRLESLHERMHEAHDEGHEAQAFGFR